MRMPRSMSKRASTWTRGGGGGPSGAALTGMAAVEHVFHFLDGPADVLSAATAGRR